jgi:hypothetical protein
MAGLQPYNPIPPVLRWKTALPNTVISFQGNHPNAPTNTQVDDAAGPPTLNPLPIICGRPCTVSTGLGQIPKPRTLPPCCQVDDALPNTVMDCFQTGAVVLGALVLVSIAVPVRGPPQQGGGDPFRPELFPNRQK